MNTLLLPFNLGIYSPILRTMVAVSRGTSPDDVTHLMEPALPYELGSLADMLPIYVRGTAYLAVNAPAQAESGIPEDYSQSKHRPANDSISSFRVGHGSLLSDDGENGRE